MNLRVSEPVFERPLVNVGSLFDIPTGKFIKGNRDEMILSGGLGMHAHVTGAANSNKSTLSYYLLLTAVNRMRESKSASKTGLSINDTESTATLDRINTLSSRLEFLGVDPAFNPDVISLISKDEMLAGEWIDLLHKFIVTKGKDKSLYLTYEGFLNRITKKIPKLLTPTGILIDSLTELESKDTAEAVSKGEIENSNTIFMRQGLMKSKFLQSLNVATNQGNLMVITTSHLGSKIDMGGMFAPKEKKPLQGLKQGESLKGVSSKLVFLTTTIWGVRNSKPFIQSDTKLPTYPSKGNSVANDLQLLTLDILRSKTGPTNITTEVLVSQSEGLLPGLTEFNYLKKSKFGLDGNLVNYNLFILPEVKLSRTTVRDKIDSDAKLRRALNITSELLQLSIYMPKYREFIITPEELYNKIKEAGYSWEFILEHTRGYWTIDQYHTDSYFFSILDILRVVKGTYKPYWFNEMKKHINKGKK